MYATTDKSKGGVFKTKFDSDGSIIKVAKAEETPLHCEVDNTGTTMTLSKLDRQFYIDMAKRKVTAFIDDEGEADDN